MEYEDEMLFHLAKAQKSLESILTRVEREERTGLETDGFGGKILHTVTVNCSVNLHFKGSWGL